MTWILFTAGRGPGECQVAVSGLLAALNREARDLGVETAVLETEPGAHGPLSVLVALSGDEAHRLASSWSGTVRWICPSPIRKGVGRKNWYVGVSVISPPTPGEAIMAEDLKFEACKASGPGGQHVNKTNSAVRVTHGPTGLMAFAQEERSQHRNKALAVARLARALKALDAERDRAVDKSRWGRHDALERGNEVRVYEGPDFIRKL